MAAQGLVVGAALVAGYFAARSKASEPAKQSTVTAPPKSGTSYGNTVGQQIQGAADMKTAAGTPGNFTAPDGGHATSDGHGVIMDPVFNGTTSSTPSGDTLGGNTSSTPSSGPITLPILGMAINTTGSSTPDGPSSSPVVSNPTAPPAPQPQTVSPTFVKYGVMGGLTSKQAAQALHQEGPGMGLVW